MKLTRKTLNEHHIFNSYNIWQLLDNPIYLDYCPADNGRLTSHYAYWKYYRKTDKGIKTKDDFTVTCREQKYPVLEQAIKFIKDQFNIVITDKDPFGGYHPEGSLKRLEDIIGGY